MATATIASSDTTCPGSEMARLVTGGVRKKFRASADSSAHTEAGHTPPSRDTASTPTRKIQPWALTSQRGSSREVRPRTPTGTRTAPAQASTRRVAGRGAARARPPEDSVWVTMCTSMEPDCWTTAEPMPSSNSRRHLLRREVPNTSWVALTPRAKSNRVERTSSPATTCTPAPMLAAISRTCGMWSRAVASPSPRTTCTTTRSAEDREAMRLARRTSASDSGPPVTATTTRSRASQVSVIRSASRYRDNASSTRSASHSSASSRRAVRLPTRK